MTYSIKDVAKIAGVSPSTVSRTINNSAYVDPDKKKRILEVIEKLNYRPNFSGRSLKQGSTNIIAVLLPNLYNPYYTKLSQSLEKIINNNNFLMLLSLSNDNVELEKKYLEEFTNGIADGIIFIPTASTLSKTNINEKYPLVVINREIESLNYVTLDNEKAAYDSVRFLIKKGHKRIICYIGDTKNPIYQQRKQGCIRAFTSCSIDFCEDNFKDNITNVQTAYEVTNKLLDSNYYPTAIFSTMDVLAFGIYSSVTEHKLNIPRDISIMGFDNNLFTENFIPPLTTYDHSTDLIAINAMNLLNNQIKNIKEKCSIVLDGEILERQSVCKI